MCGIAGVASRDPSVRSPEIVRTMLRALRHRGPDDEGLHVAEGATIGARRLAIIDIAGGHQPMTNEDGSVIAVQNGEIYNFMALREELAAKGHPFRTRSDTEVLPHGWEQWREELVPRLLGMFAIAVWSGTDRTLLLARDRFGKKPLHYAVVGDAIVFASEIQGLLAHPCVDRAVDEKAIAEYLTLGYIPTPRSGFARIKKLPPGHAMAWREGREAATPRRYWTVRYQPKLRVGMAEASEELRRRIDVAVQRRLISDVPLGAFLSGGLDSSTVVAYMARNLDRPVRTFSVRFEDGWFDESRYARIVARAFGTDHHELDVRAADVEVLPMLVRHLGEPYNDSSIVPTYHIARVTRPHVTVVLTGDGGDELFAGYSRYRAAMIAAAIPRPAARALSRLAAVIPERQRLPRVLARARRFLRVLGRDPDEQRLEWTGSFGRELRASVAGERLADSPTSISHIDHASELTDAEHISERYMAADVLWYLADDLLVKMDIATMACSLEARSPLLDHELHEFVARLPVEMKLSLRTSKVLLRRAMRDILPREILARRRKMGFTAPVGAWLRGPLRELTHDALLSSTAAQSGYVSGEGIRALLRDHVSGRADRTVQLWSLLILELWFREVVAVGAVPRSAIT